MNQVITWKFYDVSHCTGPWQSPNRYDQGSNGDSKYHPPKSSLSFDVVPQFLEHDQESEFDTPEGNRVQDVHGNALMNLLSNLLEQVRGRLLNRSIANIPYIIDDVDSHLPDDRRDKENKPCQEHQGIIDEQPTEGLQSKITSQDQEKKRDPSTTPY